MKTLVDRVEAGRLLGQRLAGLKLVEPVVLALPRGGVAVAAEVARSLLAGRAPVPLAGKSVVLVNGGMAPAHVVAQLRAEVDDLVCLSQPKFFHAVGPHYRNLHQIEDDEVIALPDAARR